MIKLYTTGTQAPVGVVERHEWQQGEQHVHAGIVYRDGDRLSGAPISVTGTRKPTNRLHLFRKLQPLLEPRHYWHDRCIFFDGCHITGQAKSALFTRCIFFGSIGLHLANNPGGPVIVDRCRFKRNQDYGIYGAAEGFGLLNSKITGPGSGHAHGLRIAGGQDVCIQRSTCWLKRAFTSFTLCDGINAGGVPRYVFRHGSIVNCRSNRGGLRPHIAVAPQNPVAAANGAKVQCVDIIGNKIKSDDISWRGIVLCADRVNIMDNTLDCGPEVRTNALGDTFYKSRYGPVKVAAAGITRGHIHLREMAGAKASNLFIVGNVFKGSCKPVEGRQG